MKFARRINFQTCKRLNRYTQKVVTALRRTGTRFNHAINSYNHVLVTQPVEHSIKNGKLLNLIAQPLPKLYIENETIRPNNNYHPCAYILNSNNKKWQNEGIKISSVT